jgi:hypothetical protein
MSPKSKKKKIANVQCLWGLLCSLSSIDQERNNLSLFNVIDQITLPKQFFSANSETKVLPFGHELVTLWRRTIDTKLDDRELAVDVEIALIDPHEAVIHRILSPLKFASGSRRSRFRVMADGIHLTTPGDYFYRISIVPMDGKEPEPVCFIPLEVKER